MKNVLTALIALFAISIIAHSTPAQAAKHKVSRKYVAYYYATHKSAAKAYKAVKHVKKAKKAKAKPVTMHVTIHTDFPKAHVINSNTIGQTYNTGAMSWLKLSHTKQPKPRHHKRK
jgi:hypothetical protein